MRFFLSFTALGNDSLNCSLIIQSRYDLVDDLHWSGFKLHIVCIKMIMVIMSHNAMAFKNTRGVQFNLLHFDCAVKTAHCVKPIKSLLQ